MKSLQIQILILFLIYSNQAISQNKPLEIKDYARWSRIVTATPASDGKWFAYALRPNGGDDTLHLKSLTDGILKRIPFGLNPSFSENSNFFSYFSKPNKAETEKLKKEKKPILQKAYLQSLIGGDSFEVESAHSMDFSSDEKYWLVHRQKEEGDKESHKGSDLVVYITTEGKSFVIGNVSEFALNKKSSHLAYIVDAKDKIGNGIYLLNLTTMSTNVLDSDQKSYQGLVWDDKESKKKEWSSKGNRFAVLKGEKIDSLEQQVNELLVVSEINAKPVIQTLNSENPDFPKQFVISEKSNLRFLQDGSSVWFGIKEQEIKFKADKDTIPNVDVWHWKDSYIQSVQIVRANRDRNATFSSIYLFGQNKFVRLSDDDLKTVLSSGHNVFKIGLDEKPYISDINWGVSPADMYRVNVKNGERILVEKLVNRPLQQSPDGKYYLYQKDTSIIAYNLETNTKINVSSKANVKFMDLEHPYPHEKPPYGVAGWTKDGKNVILNHKFDLWILALDGSKAENITKIGDKEEIRFRHFKLDKEEEWIDTKKPILLEAYGEWTKKNGYYELKLGGNPAPLFYVDAMIGSLQKPEKAEKLFFTKQTFEEFPDFFTSDSKFGSIQKITDANPQQEEYAWGRRKLVDFTNSKGQRLQGTLTLPAGYIEGKQYPTIMYFYEKMSDRHHAYSMPVYDDRPHFSTYASNGYMVFMPDIIFEEGKPGTSSLDAVTSAAKKLIELGFADKNNIGLQGHSWGGYQTSFILTQTDMFKCIVTGAPPTNLESFYNNIYGSSGTVHHGIMEIGQVRMGRGVTPWTHREDYNRENPMRHVPNIKTPFLILHGTKDGAVDWGQGLELYNAARRMGKEVIFLSYPNEGHHLSNEANQKDFQVRMKAYFDHYLMNLPAPEWMENGVPHLDKLYDKVK
ncbi:alpha/beta hydrolase family protein [Cognataquiflexum rubidum]|uniref:alpha/beta hydrolase family protein n=1 Tax=Cognataquiflexum rubidum TaxID=2922273 RepID=UPI001F144E06|nr:prolyl oligopeptidase family serine peptidase [Cognataquiflexum rubidum]MCH6236180.1 prolyl oligopeptidase family serine peptidase [Cognataquiflexum rubidum]